MAGRHKGPHRGRLVADASSADLLSGFVPAPGEEARDVGRVRRLLATGDPWDRGASFHLTGSALVVHPPTQRVLLRYHERLRAWMQVGGHGDPGETDPLGVALREAGEETGLPDLRPWPAGAGRVLHVVVVDVPASALEPAHEHGDLRYVLATSEPGAARPESPGAPLRWLTVDEAAAEVREANLRESLRRLGELLVAHPEPA